MPSLAALATLAIHAGRQKYPQVSLPEQALLSYLGALADPPTTQEHLADLYLACGSAQGLPSALEVFEEQILRQLPGFLAHLRLTQDQVLEVAQELRKRLLVSEKGQAPRISRYSGRSPLGGFVRTAAVRVALNLRRGTKAKHHVEADISQHVIGIVGDSELELLKNRYRGAFHGAVQKAVLGLREEERALLQLYLVEGLTVRQIGAIYGKSHPTISRELTRSKEAILQGTRSALGIALGVDTADFQSLVRLFGSQLDISLAGVLGHGDG